MQEVSDADKTLEMPRAPASLDLESELTPKLGAQRVPLDPTVQIRAMKVLDFGMKARIAAAGVGAFLVVLLVGFVALAQTSAPAAGAPAISPRRLTILAGRSLDVTRPSHQTASVAAHARATRRLK